MIHAREGRDKGMIFRLLARCPPNASKQTLSADSNKVVAKEVVVNPSVNLVQVVLPAHFPVRILFGHPGEKQAIRIGPFEQRLIYTLLTQ